MATADELDDDVPPALAARLFEGEKGAMFKLAENIYLTQGDIRNVQLAKAAVSAGVLTLADTYEITLGEDWARFSVPLAEIIDPRFSYTCVNQLVWRFKPNNEEKTVNFWLDDIELTGGKRLSIWKR